MRQLNNGKLLLFFFYKNHKEIQLDDCVIRYQWIIGSVFGEERSWS